MREVHRFLWQYTLDRLNDEPELRNRLRDIDLYKVGHHGSRDATPARCTRCGGNARRRDHR